MKGYGQHCPIARAAEIFAERWTPIIVRNLALGCSHFGEILEGAPGLPRSVLSTRLRRLERDGVVRREQRGRATTYHLTEAGAELADVCVTLGFWGARWTDVRPEHRDPFLMLWFTARLLDPASLPSDRVVVQFDLTDARPSRYWVVADRAGAEVCVRDPGFVPDAVMVTDTRGLLRWHTGLVTVGRALRSGDLTVTGPRWAVRELDRWGRLSPFAGLTPLRPAARPAQVAATALGR